MSLMPVGRQLQALVSIRCTVFDPLFPVLQVVSYLMEAERMHVVVEPRMYEEAAAAGLPLSRLFTFAPQEADRCDTEHKHTAVSQHHQQQQRWQRRRFAFCWPAAAA